MSSFAWTFLFHCFLILILLKSLTHFTLWNCTCRYTFRLSFFRFYQVLKIWIEILSSALNSILRYSDLPFNSSSKWLLWYLRKSIFLTQFVSKILMLLISNQSNDLLWIKWVIYKWRPVYIYVEIKAKMRSIFLDGTLKNIHWMSIEVWNE